MVHSTRVGKNERRVTSVCHRHTQCYANFVPPGVAIKEKLLFGNLANMGLIYTDIFMYLHSNNEVYLRYYSDYFNLFNW